MSMSTLKEMATGFFVRHPSRLLKLYIEPTNRCNLNCKTCVRREWKETTGVMSEVIFDNIIKGLSSFTPRPTVFFGGLGEPLLHPDIIKMIRRVKKNGSRVEMISNGTLLTKALSQELSEAGLDLLWVSVDGSTPESFSDIRSGAALPKVIENLKGFSEILKDKVAINTCGAVPLAETKIGIAFVAMKRNIGDLPSVMRIAKEIGANHFLVTNLLPYTLKMRDEILYQETLSLSPNPEPVPILNMPLMDVTEKTRVPLFSALSYGQSIQCGGQKLVDAKNRCPFIEDGVGAIGWDGGFSPCLPLMHDHVSYYFDRKRVSRRWIVGNVKNTPLKKIWNKKEHISFRERVKKFDYAPCLYCGGCDLAEDNEEDCQGNIFPTCGGCLWSQGIIQCP